MSVQKLYGEGVLKILLSCGSGKCLKKIVVSKKVRSYMGVLEVPKLCMGGGQNLTLYWVCVLNLGYFYSMG